MSLSGLLQCSSLSMNGWHRKYLISRPLKDNKLETKTMFRHCALIVIIIYKNWGIKFLLRSKSTVDSSYHQLCRMCSFHLCNHFWATLAALWHESQYKRSNWNNKQNVTSTMTNNKRTLGFIHKTSNLCSKQYMNSRFSYFQNLSGWNILRVVGTDAHSNK